MKSIKNHFSFFLFIAIFFSACNFNSVDIDDSSLKTIPDGKALVSIKVDQSDARSLLPTLNLKNFVLTGSYRGGEAEVLAKADSAADFSGKTLLIFTGQWLFTMTAQIDEGSTTSAGVAKYISSVPLEVTNETNSLSFDMKPYTSDGSLITTGELDIKLTLSSSVQSVDKARLSVKDASGTEVESQLYNSLAAGSEINFNKNLAAGTYEIAIEFYFGDYEGSKTIQNTWNAIARISEGLISSAQVQNFNLNQIYSITYENTNDAEIDTGVALLAYTAKQGEITLPKYKKEGFIFLGWYDNPECSGTEIESFNPRTLTALENKTFYAGWASKTIYVKQDGNGNGYSEDSPIASFAEAVEAIKKVYNKVNEKYDYTIKVCGEVKGCQNLPVNLEDYAKSLKIEGNSGNSTDILNGNGKGSVIKIASNITVEIDGIKITGGNAENGFGGGIFINEKNFNLTLKNTIITENTATKGGAIYCVKQKVNITLGQGCEVSKNNASAYGGGIYIEGPSTNYESSLIMTGGIIKENQAVNGGAVYVSSSAFLKMSASAQIPFNGGIGKNDVYLVKDSVVNVTGDLTASGTVATITPFELKKDVKVVEFDTSKISDTSTYYKFAVSTDGWDTILSEDKKHLSLDRPIYVAGKTTYHVCSAAGNDTSATGSRKAPYATLKKACESMNNKDSDYLIFIDGEVTGAQEIPSAIKKSTHAKSITITGLSGNTKDSLKGGFSDSNKGTTLSVASDVPLTIKNLKITGGNNDDGGGLNISGEAFVTLDENTIVSGNTANNGGGLYVYGKGKVSMISNSLIDGNTATSSGGGVYVSGSDASFTMEAGSISNNKVKGGISGGGGVEVTYSTFNMYGGSISGNYIEAPQGNYVLGGAVDINTSAKFNIKGSILIPYGGEKNMNDICVRGEAIKIAGAFSLADEDKALTINVQNPSDGKEVFELADGVSGISLEDQVGKFALENEEYLIGKDGKIYKCQIIPDSSFGHPSLPDVFEKASAGSTKPITLKLTDDLSLSGITPFEVTYPLVIEGGKELSSSSSSIFVVKSGGKLTIKEGVSVETYSHTAIELDGGQLIIEGTEEKPVSIDGSRAATVLINDGKFNASYINLTNKSNVASPLEINSGEVIIDNMTIKDHSKNGYGAGVYIKGGDVTFNTCFIENNIAAAGTSTSQKGGGIYMDGGSLKLISCTIKGNKAGYYVNERNAEGGGIYVEKGNITLDSSTDISENGEYSDKNDFITGKQYFFKAGVVYNGTTLNADKIQD